MRKLPRPKQCIENMTCCTSINISPSDFPSSESSQIEDYIVPDNILLQDSNVFSGSEEMVSNCLYSDTTNNLKSNNEDNIINEKVRHFLKWNNQPLNSTEKLDYINNYNLLNYSDMPPKSCLLSSLNQNVNNINDQNNKKRSKSNRAVCWGEYVECYRYQLDSSLSTIDLQMERCKIDEPSRTKSQTHIILDGEYTESHDDYNNNQKQRNEIFEVKNTCRPIINYNLNHMMNHAQPNHICSRNSSYTNKPIKRSNLNRQIEYSESNNEEDSSLQPEYLERYHNDSNRQPEYLKWQHENLNQQSEYLEWPDDELNRRKYKKGRKLEKSKLESHQNTTGNKNIRKSHINDNEEPINNRPCTADMITITTNNNIKVKNNITLQKHIGTHTKDQKRSSEKKKSDKDINEKCKLCDLVHVEDEKLKTDKHESSIKTISNTVNEYSISNEQRETLRKMFNLKPEDKNVLLMLRLE